MNIFHFDFFFTSLEKLAIYREWLICENFSSFTNERCVCLGKFIIRGSVTVYACKKKMIYQQSLESL